MQKAFNQAKSYAYNRMLPSLPPFLMTCDIGSHFEVWAGFSGEYGSYGARQTINLKDLAQPEIFDRFVAMFVDPQSLNPEKYRARVTREVAAELAKLSRWLEENAQSELVRVRLNARLKPPLMVQSPPSRTKSSAKSAKTDSRSQSAKADFATPAPISIGGGIDGVTDGGTQPVSPQEVANFLMRCIFTMFAEDVELLKGEVFTKALRDRWIPNPHTFKPEIEQLWQTMNTGGTFGFERILRFNGSFFEEATAFELPKEQLEILYAAAAKDWSQVEPAIFGTLLERALEKKERSRLGAHYTPRSYVERLVRPVVMEPLRQQWDEVELELRRILATPEGKEPTGLQQKKAEQEIGQFLTQLRQVRILDPACGTGNFLYVTLDLLKGLEQEAIARLVDVAGNVQLNVLEQVNPAQFLGIEINPRAAAIAELVIWIGYLQWYFKRYGNAAPPEPVLQAFGNIECRDAVLAYDGKEPDLDAKTGEVRSRWGGKMMKHPVTGEDVPDPLDRVVIYKYLNARAAEWPEADYIVSNPPFIGNARMREFLGDGYAETLREAYREVPETVDFVMFWWYKAAELTRSNNINCFGLITTNSIRQPRLRVVVQNQISHKKPLEIIYAVPDHPWTEGSAAVRISMTIAKLKVLTSSISSVIESIVSEGLGDTPEEMAEQVITQRKYVSAIHSNLQTSADVTTSKPLRSNLELGSQGFVLGGSGFVVGSDVLSRLNLDIVHPFMTGRDISLKQKGRYAIDANHLTLEELSSRYPNTYQWLLQTVKPEREINNDSKLRREWWRYRRANTSIREGTKELQRYIATARTAKHRVFQFLSSDVMAESEVVMIFLEDSYFLGVLSSFVHAKWCDASGGSMGVFIGNIRYNHTLCFYPFPFPDPTPEQRQKIRELGDRLDSHRKQVQAAHPDITITGMYNLLEKLRAGEPFTDVDRAYNNRALVSTLKQIHDDLDTAVFAAYGWQDLAGKPTPEITETILERLVALNAERAAEERNGHIRWLRPEYQAPEQVQSTQTTLVGIGDSVETAATPVEQQKWPNQPKDQLAAIRDLLRSSSGAWTVVQIANQFTGKNTQKKLEAIGENLDRLEWFGLLVKREDAGTIYWQYAELQQTA